MTNSENKGLHQGAKVAIIGGGVTGAAMAAALLFTARTRGKKLQVEVFEGANDDGVGAPVILSAECRSRLAALGCKVHPAWRGVELSGIDVCRGSLVERIDCPPGGIWVVDGWPERESGKRILATALSSVAALQGAVFHPRSAEKVETDGSSRPADAGDAPMNGPPPYIVRACGKASRFHAVINASGAAGSLGDNFFEGFSPAPTMPAAHARVTVGPLGLPSPTLRIVLAPVPGVDALYLIPCKDSLYALAYGPKATPADLCQALMGCARDGHLPEGFEIGALAPTTITAGVSSSFIADGRLTVGPAAFGHPFQLTISAALASCSRAAIALLEVGVEARALKGRYLHEGIAELLADARVCVKANYWLRHAGSDAVRALTRGQTEDRFDAAWTTGMFGLAAPSAIGVLSRARTAALRLWVGQLWAKQAPVLAPPRLNLARPLFYVVDDDSSVRDALSEYLGSRGAEVVCFSDELALYCAVARRPPSAIILDVVLQWVDGLSLCEGLKRHPLTRDTRVLVMSGIDRPFVRDRAVENGAEAFFAKPVDPSVLWQRLMGLPAKPARQTQVPEQFVESGRYAS